MTKYNLYSTSGSKLTIKQRTKKPLKGYFLLSIKILCKNFKFSSLISE